MKQNLNQSQSYESEYMDTLTILMKENRHLENFNYFLDTAFLWMNGECRKKEYPKM